MRRAVVALMAVALLAPVLEARTLAGVTLPDTVTVAGKTLQLNGMGLRTKMMFKIYVAGLYLEQPSRDAGQVVSSTQVKRVVMHFLSGKATKARMDDAWYEGFEANSPQQFAALKPKVDQLTGFFGDMKPGDVIEFTIEPGTGTTAALNGSVKGTIEGDDFAAALLRVWFGGTPPSPELKQGMLGGS